MSAIGTTPAPLGVSNGKVLHWWPMTITPRPADRWQTRLPNGVGVELVGVGENPSQDRPWWRPDGSPLEQAPYEQFGASVTPQINHVEREFVIRLTDQPRQAIGAQWRFQLPMGSWSRATAVRETAGLSDRLHAAAVAAWADQAAISVRFGVAAGRWRTIAEETRQPQWISPAEGESVILTVAQGVDSGEEQMRVIAQRRDGSQETSARCWIRRAGHVWQINAKFAQPALADSERFELQCRCYEWVEFSNVALWAGGSC